jgi:hypothetical protein
MIRAFTRRSSPALLDDLLRRRRARQEPEPVLRVASGDNCARVVFCEMMAAATVLDFGGFAIEMPTMDDRPQHDRLGHSDEL